MYFSAILITGGYNGDYLKSAEMFLPSSNTTCSLPQLPEGRYDHTQDGGPGLACGGPFSSTWNSCDRWIVGTWTRTSHTLREKRGDHLSWSTAEGVFLIGGWDSLGWDGMTSELVKEDGSVEEGFALKYNTR